MLNVKVEEFTDFKNLQDKKLHNFYILHLLFCILHFNIIYTTTFLPAGN